MSLFLGLDVGTQGTKGVLLDTEAGIVARASSSYDLIPDLQPGAAEQHPATWWDAVKRVVAELGKQTELKRVAGVGVSGQQHGFVPLDDADKVIRPAKLWCDTSTATEARELSEACGHAVPTGFTASKILWFKKHEPQHFARLRHVLLPHDWINLKLTGRKFMENGDASGTGFFDPRERQFSKSELAAIDPTLEAMLPELIDAGEAAGPVTDHELGLPRTAIVSVGGGDNMMSAIGSGAVRPGVVVLSLGTSGTVFTYSDKPVIDPDGLIAPFCDSTGGWMPLLCVMNCTNVTEEVRNAFGMEHEALTEAATKVPSGCDGLLFVPYLQGERVPDLPEATGALLGARPGLLSPGHLYRAAIEGVSLNLAWGIDRMRELGVELSALRVVGGGSNNPLWCQILADILQVPLTRLGEPESGALGAAIQACWTWERAQGNNVDAATVADRYVSTTGAEVLPSQDGAANYAQAGRRLREFASRS